MRAHQENAEVQEEACLALYNLAYDRDYYRKVASHVFLYLRRLLLHLSPVNLSSLEPSPTRFFLSCSCASWALLNDAWTPAIHEQDMVEAGGPDDVQRALDLHCVQDHPALHRYGGWCLERLAGLPPGTSSPPGCFISSWLALPVVSM